MSTKEQDLKSGHGIVAVGANYFDNPQHPLTVRRIKAGSHSEITHEHDLTEIRHTHDFCELSLITKGSAMHWLEGAEFPVTTGDVFVLQGHQSHYYYDLQNLEMTNIMFDPELLNLPEARLRKIPGYRALFLLEPLFRKQHRFTSHLHLNRKALAHSERIALELDQELRRKLEGYEAAMFAKFVELVVFLSRLYQDSGSTNAEALLRVAKVIGCIEDDFAKQWKVEDFAAMAHMSRANFMRVFRTATGETPINYLLQLRIQKAMTLLMSTKLSVSEIAFEVGFNDSNYFTRQFKASQNMSPVAYRRSHSNVL
ncbi:AraC family transcriptional regulator [Pelagicoccus sp. NFK12]|uniref:AraC family transcriptional regulator n=1 Tax=Pelagicoccus enzymogenes TaxID=2773457 RepID=A0A927F9A1_9BACT|nr:AraC family transcriptional regulator [Pelagicoccus enzymogenes]MBD5780220.1 AraC family transcriptional regulator [Pelagicoccus enzymogenes]